MQGFQSLLLKVSDEREACHMLYMRQHIVREKIPEKPQDKTLFLMGVPPYCSEKVLKQIFGIFGNVINVYLHKSPNSKLPPKEDSKFFPIHDKVKGFKVAYIVFEKEKDLKSALENTETLQLPKVSTGTKKWLADLQKRIPNTKELENEIAEYMKQYDNQTELQNKKDKNLTEVDSDGWITVTKKGRRPGFSRKESVKNQLTKRKEKQQRKKELSNFYRFQIRESKMKNLVSLRQRFEEDKKKLAALKQARKFKPF